MANVINPFFTQRSGLKKKIKSDPQRHRVYRMERDFMGPCVEGSNKRKTLESVLTHACRKYAVDRPSLKIVRRCDRTFGWCEDHAIYLNRDFHGNNLMTLLHELAHWIVDQVLETDEIDSVHGGQFSAVYMHLLNAYRVMPEAGFRSLAEEWRVDIDETLLDPFKSGDC